MTPCSQCKHWSLLQMISNGKPYSYYGDTPCIRCKHYTNDRDEFVPKNDPRVDSAKKMGVAAMTTDTKTMLTLAAKAAGIWRRME